ncbi:GPI-linked NAD(P)(+)--arginine ADP-ribosyltransferase 1-like [Myxocyprinus asiaticus]|uniref:GPI-linked NAD(P)(+)--arginine ADP-ribosyltransferase 1-like n=1 Tax=Myxocyprinus asiaticus TaxID=70543 RepID=UPI00222242EF|nr:GPI-linked NAD(P)(+)--arginine ADP-ribosyltransferase 1-like [Myxocyprinus asiaticus]
MLTIATLLLILTAEVAVGQDYRVAVKGQTFPLDMEPNSVDDQFEGCTKNMAYLVETKFLNEEISGNSAFAATWKEGVIKATAPGYSLTRNHSIAIYVYTSNRVYKDFNDATRSDKQKYINMIYNWYSLHFLLTEAIQILKKTQKKCQITYRGTNIKFDKDVLNKEVRFGSFASSSLNRKTSFGHVSCFEIETCEGAYVAKYSVYPGEEEVLIPPYEKFNVIAVKKDTWCKTVYVLESSGSRSDLNCAVTSVLCKSVLGVKNSEIRSDLVCPVASVEFLIHHRCQSFWLASLYVLIHYICLH